MLTYRTLWKTIFVLVSPICVACFIGLILLERDGCIQLEMSEVNKRQESYFDQNHVPNFEIVTDTHTATTEVVVMTEIDTTGVESNIEDI